MPIPLPVASFPLLGESPPRGPLLRCSIWVRVRASLSTYHPSIKAPNSSLLKFAPVAGNRQVQFTPVCSRFTFKKLDQTRPNWSKLGQTRLKRDFRFKLTVNPVKKRSTRWFPLLGERARVRASVSTYQPKCSSHVALHVALKTCKIPRVYRGCSTVALNSPCISPHALATPRETISTSDFFAVHLFA